MNMKSNFEPIEIGMKSCSCFHDEMKRVAPHVMHDHMC